MSNIMAADFLIALANYLAAKAPAVKRTKPGVELFTTTSDDTVAADAYSTLRHYDGEPANRVGRRHLAVQCVTVAKASATQTADVVALRTSEGIHGRLIDQHGPLTRVVLVGFNLLAVKELRPPRLVGGEVNGRQRAVFNFDVYYSPTGG